MIGYESPQLHNVYQWVPKFNFSMFLFFFFFFVVCGWLGLCGARCGVGGKSWKPGCRRQIADAEVPKATPSTALSGEGGLQPTQWLG